MIDSIKQMIITSRPLGWIIFWASYGAGFMLSGLEFGILQVIHLIAIGPLLSFALYAWNDIYDYESDILNPRRTHWLMGGVLDPRYWDSFRRYSIVSMLVVLNIFAFSQNIWINAVIALGIFIGLGYSIPPLRFKTRLLGDVACNTLGFICLLLLGLNAELSPSRVIELSGYLLPANLMVASWTLLSLATDHAADKSAEHHTISTRIGVNAVIIASALGYVLAAIIMLLQIDTSPKVVVTSIVLGVAGIVISLGIIPSIQRRLSRIYIIATGLSLAAFASYAIISTLT